MMELTANDSPNNLVANEVKVTVTFTIDELRLKATGSDNARERAEERIGNLMEELLRKTDLAGEIDFDDLDCEVTIKELEEPIPSFVTEYTVLGGFLGYFINGDDGELTNGERELARNLADQLGDTGHWSYPCLEANKESEFTSCDITGVYGDCYKLWWVDRAEATRVAREQDKAVGR